MSLSRILADVTVVKPVASVLLEVPGATGSVLSTSTVAAASIQVPLAAISYFNIVYSAEIDFRGLNQVVHEINAVADLSRLAFGKSVVDSLASTDSYTLLVFKKANAENLHPVDVKTFSLQRQIDERVHSQDDFNASVPTDDGEVMTFGKHVPDDAVTKSDVEKMQFGKKLTEAKTTTDTRTSALTKARTDSVAKSDTQTVAVNKSILDPVHAGDEMNAQAITDDGEVMVFGKRASDFATQTDQAAVRTGKTFSDAASSGDQLLPFDLGKGIADAPVTSEVRSVDLVRQPIVDNASPSDVKTFSIQSRLNDRAYYGDGPNAYDTYAISYFLESYALEGFPALSFGKSISDGVHPTDDFHSHANGDDDETMTFTKVLGDLSVMSDNYRYLHGKSLADSFTKSDITTFSTSKSLSDTATKSDALSNQTGKVFSDSKATSEVQTRAVGKQLNDSHTTAETKSFAISKTLTDAVHPTDDFTSHANGDDDETMLFTKTLADSFTKSDLTVKTAGKGIADSVSKSDSGSLVWTNYWDINYTVTTSGVYVGNSQTF